MQAFGRNQISSPWSVVRCPFVRFQCSAQPLAAEAASSIEQKTKNEHRTSNVQHRTSNERRRRNFATVLGARNKDRWTATEYQNGESYCIAIVKLWNCASSQRFFCSFFIRCWTFDVRCSMFDVHLSKKQVSIASFGRPSNLTSSDRTGS
jgi:hypothetical protein